MIVILNNPFFPRRNGGVSFQTQDHPRPPVHRALRFHRHVLRRLGLPHPGLEDFATGLRSASSSATFVYAVSWFGCWYCFFLLWFWLVYFQEWERIDKLIGSLILVNSTYNKVSNFALYVSKYSNTRSKHFVTGKSWLCHLWIMIMLMIQYIKDIYIFPRFVHVS